jgi:myo-inositol-1(or 4)-monophosphatase
VPTDEPTAEELSQFLEIAQQAARAGGECLMKWLGQAEVSQKGPRDFVTEADIEAQEIIRKILLDRFPDHQFVGEESSAARNVSVDSNDYCWIVDPLDGTTNFIHQLRSFAVSIALYRSGKLLVGTVFDPLLDECYSAAAGQGATLNGKPIQSSDCTAVRDALLVFSLPAGVKSDDPQVLRFIRVVEQAASLRRLGSAALNLCYVACGRTDGYWANCLKSWDVAAGWLILEEAGGVITDYHGQKPDLNNPCFCIAATEELIQELRPLLNVD